MDSSLRQQATANLTHVDPSQLNTLEWAQQALLPYVSCGLVAKPTDFHLSFSNGVGLLCLLHLCDASLVDDIDAMKQNLEGNATSKSSMFRSLRMVFTADQKLWQETCDRALRLTQQLLRINPNVHPRDLSTNSADKHAVELLINEFRIRLTKASASDSSRDIDFQEEQQVPTSSSFLGMKSLRSAFEARSTSEVPSTKTITSTFGTKSAAAAAGNPAEIIFVKKELSSAPQSTLIRKTGSKFASMADARDPTASAISRTLATKRSFSDASSPSPRKQGTTSITTTVNTLETIDDNAPVFLDGKKSKLSESAITSDIPATRDLAIMHAPAPQPDDFVASTTNVRALANTFNQSPANSHPPKPTFSERRSSLNRKVSVDPLFKTIVTTTTTKHVTDEKGKVVDVVVEKNVEVLEDVEEVRGETTQIVVGDGEVKENVAENALLVKEMNPLDVVEPSRRALAAAGSSQSFRPVATCNSTTHVANDLLTVQSPSSVTIPPLEYATDVTVGAASTRPPAKFAKPARQRTLKKFKATGPGIVHSDDDFEEEGKVVLENETFWQARSSGSTALIPAARVQDSLSTHGVVNITTTMSRPVQESIQKSQSSQELIQHAMRDGVVSQTLPPRITMKEDKFWNSKNISPVFMPVTVQESSSTASSPVQQQIVPSSTVSIPPPVILVSVAEKPRKQGVKNGYGNKLATSLNTASEEVAVVGDKMDVKTQMLTAVQQMQAAMDMVARKRSSGGVKTEMHHVQESGGAPGSLVALLANLTDLETIIKMPENQLNITARLAELNRALQKEALHNSEAKNARLKERMMKRNKKFERHEN
ncbi:hypothetical protein HDU98_004313 [Podochytrium sp. JEL0797]|nr:hypothetical protein HDU98_004313 [Podochytrium sp. JEL0797]